MRNKKKYQFGGNDTDFLNQLVDRYASSYNPQQEPQYEEVDTPEQDDPQDNSDYSDLMDKYNSLQDQFSQLSNQVSSLPNQDYNDNFLNFLFSDSDNKQPVDFSNEELGYSQPQGSSSKLSSYKNRGFRTFNSYDEGRQALENQLETYKGDRSRTGIHSNTSLLGAMSIYAPSSDGNNPQHYAQFIADKLGVSVNTPISDLDTKGWADAIQQMEGNTVGNNPGNLRQFGGLYNNNKVGYVDSTLNANNNLDWVKRLHDPSHGSIQVPGQQYRSTHLMSDNGQGYVFPEIVNINGTLQYIGNEAEDYARRTNTGIQFPPTQGSWFADNGYKKGTGVLNSIGNNGVPYNNPHYEYGGMSMVISDEDIYNGLNDPKYAKFGGLHMMLPKQMNTVRGLDNNNAVHVQDELGHSSVLVGKHDKKYFFGNVKETML